MASPPSPASLRAPGFRSLPSSAALLSPRLVFTTMSQKEASLGPYAHPTTGKPMHLFCLDDSMLYTPFKNDHGPLNLAFTFEACVRIYEKMNAKDYKRRALCLYTRPEAESKSNMALIASLFNLIVEHAGPWDAFQPIAHMELLPFRDAGNGLSSEFALSAQDVLYGMWKAGQHDILRLKDFDTQEYRYYERVENGDLNLLGDFIPFASPIDPDYINAHAPCGVASAQYSPAQKRMLKSCFDKVRAKFVEEDVGLVVRLNEELYDCGEFERLGIDHMDLYFDDGTNPTDEIVRQFIKSADAVIGEQKKKVAVHCKAGLGRTGVLIGAYLIYKYQFTAAEAIGYMRVVRPGMVVGPQQRYMQLNQLKWAGWAAVDAAGPSQPSTSLPTPPAELSQLEDLLLHDASRPLTPTRRLPAQWHTDAIGQPRKGLDGRRAVVESSLASQSCPSTPDRYSGAGAASALGDRPSPGGTIRGTKRGHGRSPVPIRAEPIPQPDLSPSSLNRSPSAVSCASVVSESDKRETKRRPGNDSPPLLKTGLSSPPPSRDATPDDDFPPRVSDRQLPPSTPARSPSTIASLTPSSPGRTYRHQSLIPRRPIPFKAIPSKGVVPADGSVSDSQLAPVGKTNLSPRMTSPRL